MKRIFTVVFKLMVRVSTVCVALPVLWIIEPFWRVRIAALPEDHFGNLALGPESYARHIQMNGMPPRTTHIFLAWGPANRQLLDMRKRHLNVIENYLLRRASFTFLPILKKTRFYNPYRHFQDHGPANWLGEPVLQFTEEEERRGRQALAKMGVGPDDWFVCFHARDPVYMSERQTSATIEYHNSIRDCSIGSYIPAMKWIADQGGFAIRMGALTEEPLPDLGPNVIDYSTHHRSDFMDVYLAAKGRFFMGNSSGLAAVSMSFGVPTAMAHMAPIANGDINGMDAMLIPKRLRRISDQRLMTFPECREMNLFERPAEMYREYMKKKYYDDRGFEWVENSPDDVLDLCHDMMDMVERRDPPQVDLVRYLQSEFRNLGGRPFCNPIGPRFALKYRSAIIPDEIFTPDKGR